MDHVAHEGSQDPPSPRTTTDLKRSLPEMLLCIYPKCKLRSPSTVNQTIVLQFVCLSKCHSIGNLSITLVCFHYLHYYFLLLLFFFLPQTTSFKWLSVCRHNHLQINALDSAFINYTGDVVVDSLWLFTFFLFYSSAPLRRFALRMQPATWWGQVDTNVHWLRWKGLRRIPPPVSKRQF